MPDRAPRPGWDDGVDSDVLCELLTTWREAFAWPEVEAGLNMLSHFRVDVDGVAVHFLHYRAVPAPGSADERVPILLVHGWPGTFVQMTRLAAVLAEPAKCPGRDVVVPSLPGFGFSQRPAEAGWGLDRMAHALHHLMTSALGYRRYAVHGSDFGLSIALRLGFLYPEHVADENLARMEAATVHELNHNLRYAPGGVVWDPASVAVGEHVISEGLADAFARQLYGDTIGYTPMGRAHLNDDAVFDKVVSGLGTTGMRNFTAWVHGDDAARRFGAEPVGVPAGAGYAVGNRLVDAYLAAEGKSAADALHTASDTIIETALSRL